MKKKRWRGKMKLDLKEGALHESLGVPTGKKIPLEKEEEAKEKAKRTGNTKLMKRAQFAINARKWKKKGS